MGEDSGILVRDVEFLKPLLIHRDGATPIQFTLDQEGGRFEAFSSAGDAASWICHARGMVTTFKAGPRERVDLGPVRERIRNSVAPEDFYSWMEERSLVYGPAFRGIRNLWTAKGEGYAFIKAEGLDCSGYGVHPALLDAAFQALIAVVDSDPTVAISRRMLLPTNLGELR